MFKNLFKDCTAVATKYIMVFVYVDIIYHGYGPIFINQIKFTEEIPQHEVVQRPTPLNASDCVPHFDFILQQYNIATNRRYVWSPYMMKLERNFLSVSR
ncbi:hypothetical protein Y032_0167g105 [Ancylostoma ceylanicum]|uniref:Uncharacterized protein n=1 Tax=Ancylostoma ceylanicum TaxID=53326 RepID=A0A016SWN1_9BILA|nr:hypothetical protein Y032_0167g105 [Ancylostoma ceylanicum]